MKNLLEFKIAQRVLITGNILENNWVDAQTGFAFLVTPRTEYGTAPWVYVQDITFTYNVLRHTASAVNISGLDSGDPQKVVRGKRILIQNNLFDDVNGKTWGGGNGGNLFQVLSGADAVTIDHNTGFQSNRILSADGIPSTNFVYENNIAPHNAYGVMGSGHASGTPSLSYFLPGFVFQKNVIANIVASRVSQSNYPAGTLFPSDWASCSICELCGRKLRFGSNQPVQERRHRRQRYRRRHCGAQSSNRFSHRSVSADPDCKSRSGQSPLVDGAGSSGSNTANARRQALGQRPIVESLVPTLLCFYRRDRW